MTTFVKKQEIFRGDIAYQVVRPLENNVVQLENVATGELSIHQHCELLEEYRRGYLRVALARQHEGGKQNKKSGSPMDMSHLKESAQVETRRHVAYLIELEKKEAFGSSQKNLCKAIAEVGASLADPRPPHYTTVHRWRRKYVLAQCDARGFFSRIDMRGGKDQSRLQPEVEAIIHERIEAVFLASKTGSAEEVHSAVFLAVQKANTTRIETEWLRVPGLRTIQRRINQVSAYDRAVARFGLKEAERRLSFRGPSRRVSRILELVEIDHTPMDLIVADEDGVAIGRPVITVVFDRFSRCVLGFSLSLAGHGTHAVFEAIRHALLPKTYLQTRYQDLDLQWECHGWFERILMDNGREFHALAVVDALLSLGIVSEYAASRDPNDKAFVERFLRTLNYSFIHRLPGTTLSKIHQRIGFKAEDEACITLEQLNRMIHVWILSHYHLRPHSGLGGRPPIEVWRESAEAFPPRLKYNADDLNIELGETSESALQHYGIDLNTFRYASPALAQLYRLLPTKSKVQVKWPSFDMGYIWVWDPLEKTYIKADNTDGSYAGLTLVQAKAVKAAIAKNPDYQQTRAEASAILREEAAEAEQSKELKTRKRAARISNKTAKHINQMQKEIVSPAPEPTRQQAELEDSGSLEAFDMESIGESHGV
ncbi:Mu transposase C-terminal domain-containing protein [Ralstonia sp. CHL-2022]|uniref:Mu transposase C-terminal domain-containing protein n=1 Tax=Ralstonia mojiangensis TaxID=2953895 RepID=UPI0021B16D8B|nr:Mu transposase C-terminal domain-containing protein [Ralstonia mojiangensis]MCT7296350.1 Mu transposase C-terminal domain-containing protein [Ralstonia mojiangensis]